MAGPFTTPVAFSTPFLSEPERSNGFVSKNVQEAIEECLALALANDRFLVLAKYNGKANIGRHLEFYSRISSDDAPLYMNGGANILAIIGATTAANATCKIGFFDKNVSETVPLYEIEFSNEKKVEYLGSVLVPLFTIDASGELVVRVTSGSINKPHLQVTFSSNVSSP